MSGRRVGCFDVVRITIALEQGKKVKDDVEERNRNASRFLKPIDLAERYGGGG